jgi:hypothetical protein
METILKIVVFFVFMTFYLPVARYLIVKDDEEYDEDMHDIHKRGRIMVKNGRATVEDFPEYEVE